MAKNNNPAVIALVAVVVVAVLLAEAPSKVAGAQKCDPMGLLPCAGAFMSNDVAPSTKCCTELKEQNQKSCLCEYKKNPSYRSYVNSPNAKRIATACKLTVDC